MYKLLEQLKESQDRCNNTMLELHKITSQRINAIIEYYDLEFEEQDKIKVIKKNHPVKGD